MSEIDQPFNLRADLRSLMEEKFDLNDLKNIAFDLHYDLENITGGQKKSEIVREFLQHLIRYGQLPSLIEYLRNERADIDWRPYENAIATMSSPDITEPMSTWPTKSKCLHAYSGIWDVRNRFELWRGETIKAPDYVSFAGRAILMIDEMGQTGTGSIIGNLEVNFSKPAYQAKYEIINEVHRISVVRSGNFESLFLGVNVVRRRRITESLYSKDQEDLSQSLAVDDLEDIFSAKEVSQIKNLRQPLGNKDFDLELKAVMGKPFRLQGLHRFEEELNVENQRAVERYDYLGLFKSPTPSGWDCE